MSGESSQGVHLENGLVAAYLDRRLDGAERARVESHLADCATCREEIIAVIRLRRLGLGRPWWTFTVPAAAAAALVLIFAWPRNRIEAPGSIERGPGNTASIVTVSPMANEVLPIDRLVLMWRAAGRDVRYHVVVTDDQGNAVWSATTADTVIGVPPGGVHRGQVYYWFVDALFPDGRSATSGVREVRTTP